MLVFALLLAAAHLSPISADSGGTVELRVWQDTEDPLAIFVSARTEGDQPARLATTRLELDDGVGRDSTYRYGDLSFAGFVIRVWQEIADPSRIEVSARRSSGGWPESAPISVALDQELDCCPYRFGDVSITEPPDTPLIAVSPGGDEVPSLAALTFDFAGPPSSTDPDQLVTIDPAADGSFAWLDERTLLFQPDYPGWALGQSYRVTVAAATAGLLEDYVHTFTAEGQLRVTYVIPGPEDIETPTNAQILVQFNRSVTSLTVLDEAPIAPLLEITPALEGQGEWLNTSLYRFIPTEFQPNTRYTVRIPAALTVDAYGALAGDYEWSFTTVAPAVATITPHDRAFRVLPFDPIVVEFTQPMDRESVEAGLIVRVQEGEPVGGTFEWNDESTTVSFTPEPQLELLTEYEVVVPAGLQGQGAGGTRRQRQIGFTTIEPLELERVSHSDGGGPSHIPGLWLLYNREVDSESVKSRLSILDTRSGEPVSFDEVEVHGRWAHANARLDYSATYNVRIDEGVRDQHGFTAEAYETEFRTDAYEPPEPRRIPEKLSLAVPGSFTTLSANGEQRLYFHAQGLNSVRFSLYQLSAAEAQLLLGRGYVDPRDWRQYKHLAFWPDSEPIHEWVKAIDQESLNASRRYSLLLGSDEPLARGHYLLIAESPPRTTRDENAYRLKLVVSVVDTAVFTKQAHDELLVWAVDHDSGEPLNGATVLVEDIAVDRAEVLPRGQQRAVTDSFGLASAVNPGSHIVHVIGDDQRFGVLSRGQLGTGSSYHSPHLRAQVYTERSIYRAGETVFFKGIARHDSDASYSLLPAERELSLHIKDSSYNTIFGTTLTSNEVGSFSGQFELPPDAPTGWYRLRLGTTHGCCLSQSSFLVSQFRVPEFAVDLRAPASDYIAGETMRLEMSANYFFGTPVADVEFSWDVRAQPSYMYVPSLWRYSFWDRRYYWSAPEDWRVRRGSGSGRTDQTGFARLEPVANLEPGEGTARFTISAIVTDTSGQSIGDSRTVTVHPARYYAGIATDSYLADLHEPTRIDLVTIDYLGNIAPERAVTVRLVRVRWDRETREYVDVEVNVQSVTTNADGEASITFTPTWSGRYRLVAESMDEQGRVARSSRHLWVAGGDRETWPTLPDNTIQLIADRDSYEVGDVARVLVPAPYAGATGLVTLERGTIHSAEVRRFETGSEVLEIPIEDRHIPNIYVVVVLYRPPTDADPYPRFHVGYVNLSVSAEPRRLNVSITPDRNQASPGETVDYRVRVTDAEGRGIASELSVAIVDQAVHSLVRADPPDFMSTFWSERRLGVQTTSSVTISLDRRNELFAGSVDGLLASGEGDPLKEPYWGYDDEEDDAMMEEDAATDGDVEVASAGDDDFDPSGEPRSEFRNTALWLGHLQTNERGEARFELSLPDNVTTWLATAHAATTATQVGSGESELLVTKPLLVRPALPRFVRVGDELSLRTLVTNRTARPQSVTVSIRVSGGVELEHGTPESTTIEAGGTAEFSWLAAALEPGSATVTFSAIGSSDLSDAVAITIPSELNITAEAVATGGVVDDAAAVEALYLPSYLIPGTGSLELRLQASLVGLLNGELHHFRPRRNESNVAVASRLVATIAAQRASGTGFSESQSAQTRSDIWRLIASQQPDGWSWCQPCSRVDYWISGWVLFALGEAQAEGFDVPADSLRWVRQSIGDYLNRETDAESPPNPNELAFLQYAIVTSIDYGDELDEWEAADRRRRGEAIRVLAEEHRTELTAWGRAYLLLGLLKTGHDVEHETVRSLLNDLSASAISSANGTHWQDPPLRGSMHNGSVRATALVLLALTEAAPRHPLIEETVRWLVVGRSQDRWKSSIERAQGMAALGAYSRLTGEHEGVYDYQALLGLSRLLTGRFDVGAGALSDEIVTPLDDLPLGEISRLQLQRESGTPGRMYYALNLRYVTPASRIEALNRGLAVSRKYSLADEPDRFVNSASIGDLVRVEVTVVAPTDRLFVRVEDFLPAGLEPVDPRLDTVSHWTRERLQEERDQSRLEGGPSYAAPWFRWYFNPWDQVDTRDDRVILLADRLPEGVYRFVYFARAKTPGQFVAPPARAEETFFPEVFGRGDSDRFIVHSAE